MRRNFTLAKTTTLAVKYRKFPTHLQKKSTRNFKIMFGLKWMNTKNKIKS